MCGILGEYVYRDNQLLPKEKFLSLLNLSKNRGRDSQGYISNERYFQLGFNRLAILDLSTNANQPIHSPSGRFTMVFNGEIYNHQDLRDSLPEGKYIFKGHGDTESLISCFDHHGIIETVKKIDGMFAIGIIDHKQKNIHLIRDFAGIKPLHYAWNRNRVIFSSQFNQVSRHPSFHNEPIDEKVLKIYLTQHFIPAPFGLLKNTYSVRPGEIITFDINGNRDSNFYWTFPKYEQVQSEGKVVLSKIENDLESAVQSELLSDVPIGAFLSGGVDSPLICYYAKNKTENEFNTFSMGSDSPIHDESMQAQKYANFLKTTHYTTHMNANNSLEALDGAVASVGEPFGDYSIIPTWQVSKIAKEKVTVALSGDGGDELFFGYDRFRSIGKNHSFWHYPYWIRYGLRGLDKLIFNEKHINECILSSNPGTSHWGLHCRFPYRWLNQIAPNLIHIDAPSLFGVYNYTNPASQEELLYNTRKAEFYGMLQKTLTKVDKASMAHGLEVRVPLLKKSLVEDILRMGIRIHQPMQGRKRILYSLLDKCYPFIPPEKTKKGFSISLSNWLKKNYQKPFRQVLLDQNYCDTFGFDKNAIKSMLVSHNSNHQDLQWPLFSLYSLAIWNKEGRSLV